MMDNFSGGYFKALMDIYNVLKDVNTTNLNSRKKYDRFIKSFLSLLLTHGDIREDMIRHGSNIDYWKTKLIIKQDGKVVYDKERNT